MLFSRHFIFLYLFLVKAISAFVILQRPTSCGSVDGCWGNCPEYVASESDIIYCNGASSRAAYYLKYSFYSDSKYHSQHPKNICALRNTFQYSVSGIYCSGYCPTEGRVCYKTVNCTQDCSLGYYIPFSDCVCSPCPAGSFCANSVIAGTCPAGTYSGAGQSNCIDCGIGNFSLQGQSVCTNCAPGKYNDMTRQSACFGCPNGKFSSGTGATVCNNCSSVYCSSNEYISPVCSVTTDNVCSSCPNQFYCNGVNATPCAPVCAPGFYESAPCTNISDRLCSPCDSGFYCTGGSSIRQCNSSCLSGSYESTACTNSTNRVCSLCEPGFYCPIGVRKYPCDFPNYLDVYGQSACKLCTLCTIIGQFKKDCGGTSAGTCADCTNML